MIDLASSILKRGFLVFGSEVWVRCSLTLQLSTISPVEEKIIKIIYVCLYIKFYLNAAMDISLSYFHGCFGALMKLNSCSLAHKAQDS